MPRLGSKGPQKSILGKTKHNAVVAQKWTLEDVPKLKLNRFLNTGKFRWFAFIFGGYLHKAVR